MEYRNPTQQVAMIPAAGEGEIDFRGIVEVLRQGRWILLACVAAGLLLALAYVTIATPVYKADAMVQVEDKPKTPDETLGDLAGLLNNESPIPAELAIIQSRLVLGKVVEDLGLDLIVTPDYFPLVGSAVARLRRGPAPASAVLGLSHFAWGGERISLGTVALPPALMSRQLSLVVGSNGYSLYAPDGHKLLDGAVGASAKADDPQFGSIEIFVRELTARPGTEFFLTKLPQSLAVTMLLQDIEAAEQGTASRIIGITYQNPSPSQAMAVTNAIVNSYQRQNVERLSAEAAQTLDFLHKQLPEIKDKLEVAEAALNAYRLQRGSADLTAETQLVLNQSVQLEGERLTLLQKREETIRRFTPDHPVVQALDAQLAQITQKQNSISTQIKALPETQQRVLTLTRDVEVNNTLYTSILNSTQSLQIAKAGTVGNIRIIDYAVLPIMVFKPKRALIFALALLVGLFAGVGAIIIRKALHNGVTDPALVEQHLGLPTYGSIPYSDEQRRISRTMERDSQRNNNILALSDSNSLAIEALRSLRTSLHFALLESENNVVMLTGPSPGLGKSFISINLGVVLALSGKRVVVVDADMRRGHLHDYLGLGNAPGISDFVSGQATAESVVRTTPQENLKFVSTGTPPPNPAELVLHERFGELIKILSANFDYVLVDTPPVLAVTDAAVIGRLAGCALLVLKAGEHPMGAIEESVRRLQQSGVKLRGTLFNYMSGGATNYGYQYGYTYSYKPKNQ